MPTVTAADRYELKVFIDGPSDGFSHIYHMPLTTLALAKTRAAKIISTRADILAKDSAVVHASLSLHSVTGDSYRPDAYRTGPINLAGEALITNVATVNDREVGILYRIDTNTGKFRNYLIKWLRDAQIVANAALDQTVDTFNLADTNTTALAVAATTTHADAMKLHRSCVFHYTRHYDKFGAVLAGSFQETDWGAIQYRRVGSRDNGRRFQSSRGRQPAWA